MCVSMTMASRWTRAALASKDSTARGRGFDCAVNVSTETTQIAESIVRLDMFFMVAPQHIGTDCRDQCATMRAVN